MICIFKYCKKNTFRNEKIELTIGKIARNGKSPIYWNINRLTGRISIDYF